MFKEKTGFTKLVIFSTVLKLIREKHKARRRAQGTSKRKDKRIVNALNKEMNVA